MFNSIMAWLSGGWSKILPWLVAIISLAGAYFGVRQAGKNAAYVEMAEKQARLNAEALRTTQGIDAMSDVDVDSILRRQFGTN